MKAFTERNPVVIGVIVVSVIALFTTGALALNGGYLKHRYTVHARFVDAAGLQRHSRVRVAGIVAGEVSGVRAHGDRVDISLKIDRGVELPRDVKAGIVVETLLGSKYVRLSGGHDWKHPLRGGDLILHTRTPTEVLDLENVGTPLLERTDAKALDQLLGKIDRITQGQRGNVGDIVVGLDRLARAVDERQAEARRLIRSTRVVTGRLAARDQDLLAALDDIDVVLDGLAKRRVQVVTLLRETEATSAKTADLVAANRRQLDAVLDEIHQDLQVVGRNQDHLAESMAAMSNAISGFASVGYSGPDEYPNTWANMYTQLIGPLSPDALFGSCGLLDDAFDVMLGPDPVTDCSARTGPLPSASRGGSGQGSTPAVDPLGAMYGPLAGGGS
ncbi:MAG: MlaD family protein [Acidimicrobiales bacterium]